MTLVEKLVEHFITQEFTNGTFGDGCSDAIHIVQDLPPKELEQFADQFTTKLKAKLMAMGPSGMSITDLAIARKQFARFNEHFGGRFLVD